MKTIHCFIAALLLCGAGVFSTHANNDDIDVGIYYFPNFHVDPYNEKQKGEDWTEWELVQYATPRFEGHWQPRIPLWGYVDEADPEVMERKLTVASEHGIDFFIFDWYFYDGHEFLNRALDEGYFEAENNQIMPFCLMWANHDWMTYFPVKVNQRMDQIWEGGLNMREFDKMTDVIVEKYFSHPNYYLVDGKPYFSIFLTQEYIDGFESMEQAAHAMRMFREKTKKAGFKGLHLNLIARGFSTDGNNEEAFKKKKKWIDRFDVQSVTSYNMLRKRAGKDTWPKLDYREALDSGVTGWNMFANGLKSVEYYPTLSIGWDCSPRTVQSDRYMDVGYPFSDILVNDTPENLQYGLERIKEFALNQEQERKIVVLNAFNEWTEGSYLEPDFRYGYGKLKALEAVFGEN